MSVNIESIKAISEVMTRNGWSMEIETQSKSEGNKITVTGTLLYKKYGELKTFDDYKKEFTERFIEEYCL